MLKQTLRRELSSLDRRRGPGLSATQLFVGSFLALILFGTLGLLLLPGLYTGPRLGPIDALFTATSAVCVTGLIVVDTATWFTTLGQAWILLLIQLGGLGIVTLATLVIVSFGRRLTREVEEVAGGGAQVLRHTDELSLVRAVVLSTLAIEAVGALVLWLLWMDRMGPLGAIWPAIFHAVSAFCNAGFSTFSDSMMGFRSAPLTLLCVSLLIVLGGIGFVVLADLWARYVKRTTGRLSLHSRLVLGATATLLVVGAVLYLAFESVHGLRGMSIVDRVANAWFMSATPRTAGFNSVDYGTASNASIFLTLLMMIVGGSPGSTAGGVKTTTVLLLLLLLWSRLRGKETVSAFGRTVPRETAERSAGVFLGGLLVLGVFVFLLMATEMPRDGQLHRILFLQVVFEAHSAFGTVGLSMGLTPELTPAGRLLVSALMLIGRVGPLAAATSMLLAGGDRPARFRYAHEDVVVG